MRKEQRNRLTSEPICTIREVDEFYDPLQPIKPITDVERKPMNACVSLFNDDDEFDESPFSDN